MYPMPTSRQGLYEVLRMAGREIMGPDLRYNSLLQKCSHLPDGLQGGFPEGEALLETG